ncbi:MAG: zinc ribbon domain-containing protein [Vicinamibacterales bacterium]
MPIYEYRCRRCSAEFETLVRAGSTPQCPQCAGQELERLLSLPAIKSEGTHALAMKAAKKRDAHRQVEQTRERVEYERNHDD